jgi:hypothetical protein|nr:MAG: hypothetical protein TU35_06870 [Thermoproteus sp. AZ2]
MRSKIDLSRNAVLKEVIENARRNALSVIIEVGLGSFVETMCLKQVNDFRGEVVNDVLSVMRSNELNDVASVLLGVLMQHASNADNVINDAESLRTMLNQVIGEYVEALRLGLLGLACGGGEPLSSLVYAGDKLARRIFRTLMAFFMQYTDIYDHECSEKCNQDTIERLSRLALLELTTTILLTMHNQGKLGEQELMRELDKVIDWALAV